MSGKESEKVQLFSLLLNLSNACDTLDTRKLSDSKWEDGLFHRVGMEKKYLRVLLD